MDKKPVRYQSRSNVLKRYEIGNTTLYRWIESDQFPQPVQLGPRCVRWLESDLEQWEKERLEASK